MNGESTKDETEFHWKELAETYSALDKKGRLGVEQRIDIVARIHERMDELPVTVGEKSSGGVLTLADVCLGGLRVVTCARDADKIVFFSPS